MSDAAVFPRHSADVVLHATVVPDVAVVSVTKEIQSQDQFGDPTHLRGVSRSRKPKTSYVTAKKIKKITC